MPCLHKLIRRVFITLLGLGWAKAWSKAFKARHLSADHLPTPSWSASWRTPNYHTNCLLLLQVCLLSCLRWSVYRCQSQSSNIQCNLMVISKSQPHLNHHHTQTSNWHHGMLSLMKTGRTSRFDKHSWHPGFLWCDKKVTKGKMFSSPAGKQKQTSYLLCIYSFSQKKGKLNFHLFNTSRCVTVILLQHFSSCAI